MAAVDGLRERALSESERTWLSVRSHLIAHRHELDIAAAAEYPRMPKAFDTPLLTGVSWIPARPLPLEALALEFRPDKETGRGFVDPSTAPLPTRPDGTRYPSYSAAMAELAAPAVFENRPTYRLLAADLTGTTPTLTFGRGQYFDGLDVGEAAAHEYAGDHLGITGPGLRQAIGDPTDLARRPANLAISTLTLAVDETGHGSFLLHWRDPAKVGHAGGLYQVLPVGVFQPIDDSLANEVNDFSLWRSMVREYAEELLGEPELTRGPIDYDTWPFAAAMTNALRRGDARAYVLGLGVDPLTLATDLLTALVLPRSLFAELFARLTSENTEGHLVANDSDVHIPFTEESVRKFAETEPTQAAGAALLKAAWTHANRLIE